MRIDWRTAHREWHEFLDDVERARKALGCENDHAWFRGIDSPEYDLTPSLLRTVPWREISRSLPDLSQPFEGDLAKAMNQVDPYSECSRLLSPHATGEYDAFSEFAQRAEINYPNSWEQLAAMQHYGCGTRLADWTDDFHVALGFALVRYYEAFSKCRVIVHAQEMPRRAAHWAPKWLTIDGTGTVPTHPRNEGAENLGPAAVWIMNPYKVAAWAWGKRSIPNTSLHIDLDYDKNFLSTHMVSWKFLRPLPLVIPWANRRIRNQRGTFCIQGLDPRPLNELVAPNVRWNQESKKRVVIGADMVARVTLSANACVYALSFLRDADGLDGHALYGDLPMLAERIRRRHIESRNLRSKVSLDLSTGITINNADSDPIKLLDVATSSCRLIEDPTESIAPGEFCIIAISVPKGNSWSLRLRYLPTGSRKHIEFFAEYDDRERSLRGSASAPERYEVVVRNLRTKGKSSLIFNIQGSTPKVNDHERPHSIAANLGI